jgi:hypothetical protein
MELHLRVTLEVAQGRDAKELHQDLMEAIKAVLTSRRRRGAIADLTLHDSDRGQVRLDYIRGIGRFE